MRQVLRHLASALLLLALSLACCWSLVRNPGALLVDGQRPSIDHAQRDDYRPVGNDLTFFYLPHFLQVSEQLQRLGRVPQWDSSGFAGRPLIGNPQAGLFYPPYRLALRFSSPSLLGWLTLAHLFWAGLGVLVLSRELGLGLSAATFAGGCFLASPYLMAQVFEGHYPHVWGASWYPWAFWAYLQLRRRCWAKGLWLAPILALTFLAGHPQEWFYLVFVLNVWMSWDVIKWLRGGDGSRSRAHLLRWVIVLSLSVGLGAIELAPDLLAQTWTLRATELAAGKVSHYQVEPLNLLQLLCPLALGGPSDFFGSDNYWETVFSLGLAPLTLAIVGSVWSPNRKLVRGWLVLIGLTAVFAAGRKLGLFSILFAVVPGLDRFRVPSRVLFLTSLGASVLAGLGVETLRSQVIDARKRVRLAQVGFKLALPGLVILVITSVFALDEPPTAPSPPDRAQTLREIRVHLRDNAWKARQLPNAASRIVRSPLFWLALVGVLVTCWGGAGRLGNSKRFSMGFTLAALAWIELAGYGQVILKVAPPSRFMGADPISRFLADEQALSSGPFRIRARDTLYSDLSATVRGIEKVNRYDSFQIQHAADLYEPLYMLLYVKRAVDLDLPMADAVDWHENRIQQAMLDRLNVAYLVSDHEEPNPSWPLAATGDWDGRFFAIHRNPTALPRAFVVPFAKVSREESRSPVGLLLETNPKEQVILDEDPLEPGTDRQRFKAVETWDARDPDQLVIGVRTEAPGYLVVSETWMPGWSAQVNGQPAQLLRGNHAQRVIPLKKPGWHDVVLRYEAPGFQVGAVIGAGSLVFWLGLVAMATAAAWGPSKPGSQEPCHG